MSSFGVVVAAALFVMGAVAFALRRAHELFCVEVRRGRVTLVRGRVPPALLAALADVLERARGADGSVRCVSEGGRPAIVVEGAMAPEDRQRLRNVVGQWTVTQIRAGSRGKR